MSPLLLLTAALLQNVPGDSLQLAGALDYGARHRGTMIVASAALRVARAGVSDARALPNPTGSYTWGQDTPRQTATLQQPLDWLLRRPGDLRAAHAGVARAGADSVIAARDLAQEIRGAFYDALAARALRGVAAAEYTVADSLARIADRRLATGDIPEAERDRLRLERVVALQGLSRAEGEEAAARLALGRAIGWSDSAPLPPLAGALSDDLDGPAASELDVDSVPAVRAAFADSVAAAGLSSSASLARIPLPDVEVGRQWDDPTVPGQTLWLVGASMPLPLFNRGGAAASAARARLAQAAASLAEARRDARAQIGTAAIRLRGSRDRARLAVDSLLPAATQLRTRAARAYALGQTGVLPLLDGLRAEREVVAGALNDLLAYQDALATWLSLTGNAR